jgi:hypothetical protein
MRQEAFRRIFIRLLHQGQRESWQEAIQQMGLMNPSVLTPNRSDMFAELLEVNFPTNQKELDDQELIDVLVKSSNVHPPLRHLLEMLVSHKRLDLVCRILILVAPIPALPHRKSLLTMLYMVTLVNGSISVCTSRIYVAL